MEKFFTVNELPRYFGIDHKTIYRKLLAKGIPAYKVGRLSNQKGLTPR